MRSGWRRSVFVAVAVCFLFLPAGAEAEVKIIPDDGSAGDQFGCSVSTSGDYAIVGARMDDDNGSDTGSAYIFKREGNTWTQEAQLIAMRLGPPPKGYANWTLRLLARKLVELEVVDAISHETVRATLKKTA